MATPTAVPPVVAFEVASLSIAESAGSVVITATLSSASSLTVTVNYTTTNGTATAGSDYVATSGTLTFPPGQTSQSFSVPITNDTAIELDETFTAALSAPTNAVLGTPALVTITITNDDLPTVQFAASEFSVNEGDDNGTGMAVATIIATLSATPALTVTVNYATADGTATVADIDYVPTSGTLTFAPGQTSQIFTVSVVNDILNEPNETVILALTGPINATLGTPAAATLTIVNDDGMPGCSGNIPPGEPDVGPPDGNRAEIACGQAILVDLGTTPVAASGDTGYDLVYYERSIGSNIQLDWVVVQVGASPSGPWFTVFYWGDGILDSNTNIGQTGYGPPEADNQNIPLTDLYGSSPFQTGIAIDVDARAPAGTYSYVRIYSPFNTNGDPTEVDSIEVLP